MAWYSWFTNLFNGSTISELIPVVSEGEQIVVALTNLINDLKSNNIGNVVTDGQIVLSDLQSFVADVTKVVNSIKTTK